MADDCGSTCPAERGFYSYDPPLAGNAVLLAAYSVLTLAALYLGFRFQTPWFSVTLVLGLLLQIVGYVGRLFLSSSPRNPTYFILSMIGSVVGPPCIGGSIFLTLPHVLGVYGEHLSPVRPLLVGFLSISLTVIAAVMQVIGVVFFVFDIEGLRRSGGLRLVIGGLVVQLVSLLGFSALHFWFTIGLSSQRTNMDPKHSAVYRSLRFRKFLFGMEFASFVLVAYSAYRIVEMAEGVNGRLFQSQAAYMVVVGVCPLIAALVATVLHPGAAFGSSWASTSPLRNDPNRHRPPPSASFTSQSPLEQIEHQAHHRYDPGLRGMNTPSTIRRGSHPVMGAMPVGLPSNPRPGAGASPIPSPSGTGWTSETNQTRHSMRYEKPPIPQRMVEQDSLW